MSPMIFFSRISPFSIVPISSVSIPRISAPTIVTMISMPRSRPRPRPMPRSVPVLSLLPSPLLAVSRAIAFPTPAAYRPVFAALGRGLRLAAFRRCTRGFEVRLAPQPVLVRLHLPTDHLSHDFRDVLATRVNILRLVLDAATFRISLQLQDLLRC